jgi:outer membrane biosynthesis protein TonB
VVEAVAANRVDRVTVRNTTTGEGARVVQLNQDGTFDSLVPVRSGQNLLEVVATATDGSVARRNVLVNYQPASEKLLDVTVEQAKNLDKLLDIRVQEDKSRPQPSRELFIEIEVERQRAIQQAEQQRRELGMGTGPMPSRAPRRPVPGRPRPAATSGRGFRRAGCDVVPLAHDRRAARRGVEVSQRYLSALSEWASARADRDPPGSGRRATQPRGGGAWSFEERDVRIDPFFLVSVLFHLLLALLLWRAIAAMPEIEPPKKEEVIVKLEDFLPKQDAGSPAAAPAPKPEQPKPAAPRPVEKKVAAPRPVAPQRAPTPKAVVQRPVPKPEPEPVLVPKEIVKPRSISPTAPISPSTPTEAERIARAGAPTTGAQVVQGRPSASDIAVDSGAERACAAGGRSGSRRNGDGHGLGAGLGAARAGRRGARVRATRTSRVPREDPLRMRCGYPRRLGSSGSTFASRSTRARARTISRQGSSTRCSMQRHRRHAPGSPSADPDKFRTSWTPLAMRSNHDRRGGGRDRRLLPMPILALLSATAARPRSPIRRRRSSTAAA